MTPFHATDPLHHQYVAAQLQVDRGSEVRTAGHCIRTWKYQQDVLLFLLDNFLKNTLQVVGALDATHRRTSRIYLYTYFAQILLGIGKKPGHLATKVAEH